MPEMAQRSSLLSSAAAATTTPSDPGPSAVPPWVHINDGSEEPLLLSAPSAIHPNTRHYRPPPPPSHYRPGRKWDHLRSAEPPLLSASVADHQVRWRPFMQSGPNPLEDPHGEGRIVDAKWMEENMPDLHPQWHPDWEVEPGTEAFGARALMYKGMWLISPERQERTVRLFWRLLLKNPFVPLGFRLVVLIFTATALGIAASQYRNILRVNSDPNPNNNCATRASTYMAISVGAVALPYIGYVTWDEYMSKPLGLRSVPAKILLLLCDLYFITFSASNLSLAFDALYDHRWACYDEQLEVVGNVNLAVQASCPDNPGICYKQKALSAVLLVTLVSWLSTFSISVMRIVEKLRPD